MSAIRTSMCRDRTGVVAVGLRAVLAIACIVPLTACEPVRNSPYPEEWLRGKVLFTSFEERPKFLDPVSSYSNNETPWTYAIYEPPLQYNYLKRPYTLEPRTAASLPEVTYWDKSGHQLPDDAPVARIATSVYRIHLRPGIRYQPHPALARDASGRFCYQELTREQIRSKFSLLDFPLDAHANSCVAVATRELTADDYVYQIKRLASPYVRTHSPIYGIMSQFIEGLQEMGDALRTERKRALAGRDPRDQYLPWRDLREVPLRGARAIDENTLEIRINGKYPQFRFWLSMPFFAPIPWEADRFYAQRGMEENGLTLNFWPIGTGPFMLTEQGPSRYIMRRNPNFRGQTYPSTGMPGDEQSGLLEQAGKTLPFLDMVVSSLEKEREPSLAKFLQGYYDIPFVERPDVGFLLQKEVLDNTGRATQLKARGIRLLGRVDPNTWYMGFNWLDPVVGKGDTPEQQIRNRKLRQAISIATDWEEHAAIFYDMYGESEIAMGPIPPGVFGHREGKEGINPVTHVWVDGHARRRLLDEARKLLAQAGYPDGRDARTGRPLVLTYDANGVTPAFQARLDWQVKQAAKLGIQLEIRAADYNRFQERLLKGAHQIFFWGWLADYPDPENFLFLLYGPQSRSRSGGENNANYQNPEYDRLYNIMKDLPDGPERQQVIDRMVQIVREDAIWMWGIFPGVSGAYQPWVRNASPSIMLRDSIKYLDVDPDLRWRQIQQWNRPQWGPLRYLLGAMLIALVPVWRVWRARERRDARTALAVGRSHT